MSNSDDDNPSRTDLAEDRTLLASERTFAGWMRTSLACVGIAVGFHALFGSVEPRWVPKSIATLFLALGVLIAWSSVNRSASMRHRLSSHTADAAKPVNMALIAGVVTLGALALGGAFWFLPDE